MMHLKTNKVGAANISEFSGFISAKENKIISMTKFVLILSVALAIIMVISK